LYFLLIFKLLARNLRVSAILFPVIMYVLRVSAILFPVIMYVLRVSAILFPVIAYILRFDILTERHTTIMTPNKSQNSQLGEEKERFIVRAKVRASNPQTSDMEKENKSLLEERMVTKHVSRTEDRTPDTECPRCGYMIHKYDSGSGSDLGEHYIARMLDAMEEWCFKPRRWERIDIA
jgi:hypothetical protein